MTREEWNRENNYHLIEKCCATCAHYQADWDDWDNSYTDYNCEREGYMSVKPNGTCDKWEKRNDC